MTEVAWQENLQRLLGQRGCVVVHGNVRDWYVDRNGYQTSLMSVLEGQLDLIASAIGATASIRRFDSVAGGRAAGDQAGNPPRDIEGIEAALAVLDTWLKGEANDAEQGTARTVVIEYADLLVPYQQSYEGELRHLLIVLQKFLEGVRAPHHVILIALEDSWLAQHLYTQAPFMGALRIPMPGEKERQAFVKVRCATKPDWHPSEGLCDEIGRITSGLYLREVEEVLARMGDANVTTVPFALEILTEWRTGRRESPWMTLRLEDDVNAPGLEGFSDWLGGIVKGQQEPIEQIARALVVARAGLSGLATTQAQKPKMAFVFAGPTGVGKTFLAKQLARFIFGDEQALIRFDMSEFKDDFTVSRLLGAPPGYIGYEQGGQLTTAVRDRPFSVLLFDEIEKGHGKILDIFLQILDDGRLTDSRGQTVYFGETAVIFTTNVGARSGKEYPNEAPRLEELLVTHASDVEACNAAVRQHFQESVEAYFTTEISRPELFNRIRDGIVPFNPIIDESVKTGILLNAMQTMQAQFQDRYRERGLRLELDVELAAVLTAGWVRCRSCRHTVIPGPGPLQPSFVCPCGAALAPVDGHIPRSDETETSSALGFGGRGLTSDIQSLILFDLAMAVLRLEAESSAVGGGVQPGVFKVTTKGSEAAAKVLDVAWQPDHA